jgi:hypothetical protein
VAFVPVVSGEWDVVAFSVFPAALHVDAWSADVAAAAGRVEGRKVGRLRVRCPAPRPAAVGPARLMALLLLLLLLLLLEIRFALALVKQKVAVVSPKATASNRNRGQRDSSSFPGAVALLMASAVLSEKSGVRITAHAAGRLLK